MSPDTAKQGDKFRITDNTNGHGFGLGTIVEVIRLYTGGDRGDVAFEAKGGWIVRLKDCEVINSSTNMSSLTLIEKIRLASKSEPEKSFIKAGVTNMDGTFTDQGKVAFFEYLLQANKDDFNTKVVQPILVTDAAEAVKE